MVISKAVCLWWISIACVCVLPFPELELVRMDRQRLTSHQGRHASGDSILVGQTFQADLPELELVKRWTGKVSQVFEGGMLRINVDHLADSESPEV